MHGIGVLRHTMRRVPVPNFHVDVQVEGVGQLDIEEHVEDKDVERENLTDDVGVVANFYWTWLRIWLGSRATVMTGRVGFVAKTSWT